MYYNWIISAELCFSGLIWTLCSEYCVIGICSMKSKQTFYILRKVLVNIDCLNNACFISVLKIILKYQSHNYQEEMLNLGLNCLANSNGWVQFSGGIWFAHKIRCILKEIYAPNFYKFFLKNTCMVQSNLRFV